MDSRSNLLSRRLSGGLAAFLVAMLLACNAPMSITPALSPTLSPVPATTTPAAAISTPTPSPTPIIPGELSSHASYTLPLTVRHVTDTNATLFFELSTPSEGVLLYDSDADGQQSVPLDPTTSRQQIVLEGLTPGVEYRAMVGLPEGGSYRQPGFKDQVWGAITFRTQSGKEPLRIGVIGDSGFGFQDTFDLATQMGGASLDFVLHTGDVVYDMEKNTDAYEAYALKYYLPFAPLLHTMPIYTVVGNHDVEQAAKVDGTPFIYRAFPPFADPLFPVPDSSGLNQWYAFAYGNIQFLMLDTQTFFNEQGRAEQLAWLTERLADQRFAYSIPVFHVPPFSSGLHPNDGMIVRTDWLPLFEAANVPLVLSGHDHNYQRLAANGITYIISGGGTATLYSQGAKAPEGIVFAKRIHFVLLEIYQDRIDLKTIALGGEVLDQTAISLSKP